MLRHILEAGVIVSRLAQSLVDGVFGDPGLGQLLVHDVDLGFGRHELRLKPADLLVVLLHHVSCVVPDIGRDGTHSAGRRRLAGHVGRRGVVAVAASWRLELNFA